MRYLPHTAADRAAMLAAIGAPTVEALFADVPASARHDRPFAGLPAHLGEMQVEQAFQDFARRSLSPAAVPSFLGAGAYRHHIPAAVDAMIQRGEFLTSYTPYQPEIAQGTLQYLFEFQTQVALLTGMEVANASLYDGATATAEAAAMAQRVTRRSKVVVSGGLHPHYRDTLATMERFDGGVVEALPPDPLGSEAIATRIDKDTACVIVQSPDVFGRIRDLEPIAKAAHAVGAQLVAVVTEAISLGALEPPGAAGADIVAAEGQSLGVPASFGGPYVGLFAAREAQVRQMPGRLCGETVDADGRRGYVLTLSTREQHIRREKATSNICTNSGLCALAFTIHLTLLGETGLARLAALNHARAVQLADRLARLPGVAILPDAFFNELTVTLPVDAARAVSAMARRGVLGGVPASRLFPERPELSRHLLLAATETNSEADIEALEVALAGAIKECA